MVNTWPPDTTGVAVILRRYPPPSPIERRHVRVNSLRETFPTLWLGLPPAWLHSAFTVGGGSVTGAV